MISRTLGPEFGGSIGTLFYFANVVSSALYLAACTEGLVNNFGPNGSILDSIPSGYWWNFAYATSFNVLNLLICLVGSKVFGKTAVLILTAVFGCILVTAGSFFQWNIFHITFEEPCFEPSNGTLIPNCTNHVNATFTGIAATNAKKIEHLLCLILMIYKVYHFLCLSV